MSIEPASLAAALPARMGFTLTFGEVPADLAGSHGPAHWMQVRDDEVLVRLPRGRRLLVVAGREVIVQWPRTADTDDVDAAWIVDTWAVPIAMLQRGLLTLHASTVRKDGSGIAVAGNSGAGKSTTAWALTRRGYEFVIDETSICEVLPELVRVLPFRRRINLTPAATSRLDIHETELRAVGDTGNKTAFLPQEPAVLDPVPLHHLIVLAAGEPGSAPSISPLKGPDRLTTLSVLAERRGLAPAILGRQRYVDLLCTIAQATPMHLLRRPPDDWSMEGVLDLVESTAS